MTVDVAVIGGGVSGLTAAWELSRQGHEVVVLERQVRPGGNAQSTRFGGFLMEHGPNSVTAASPAAAGLSRCLGLDHLKCHLGDDVRYRYLYGGGAIHRIATHPFGMLFSDFLSPKARLRLLAEPLVPVKAGGEEETVAAFMSRRFGAEFASRVMDPLIGGLFAGTAETLSMQAVFPSLVAMERRDGSVTRGALRGRRAGRRMPGRRLFAWSDGVATLPRALAQALGAGVRTGVAVRGLRQVPGGFRIEAGEAGTLEVPAVVVATQPHVAASLLDAVDEDAARALGQIDAPPLSVVFLGYRREQVRHPLDGLGYLTPSSEDRALTGTLFCSTMFSGRAPEGHVALAGYVGGERAPELAQLPAEELIAMARREFGELLGVRGSPVVARTQHWPRGLPQYRPGHQVRIAGLLAVNERRPGLFLTGNYFQGPGVAACLTQAMQTATCVARYLRVRKAEHGLQDLELPYGADPARLIRA
jgi:oxygen-dependent protoporphyrinogen oxidase